MQGFKGIIIASVSDSCHQLARDNCPAGIPNQRLKCSKKVYWGRRNEQVKPIIKRVMRLSDRNCMASFTPRFIRHVAGSWCSHPWRGRRLAVRVLMQQRAWAKYSLALSAHPAGNSRPRT